MKKYKLILVIILCVLMTFCKKEKHTLEKNKNKQDKNIRLNSEKIGVGQYLSYLSDYKKMYLLRKKMIAGDTVTYNKIKDIYQLSGQGNSVAYISIIMANKTSFPQAYFDVYESLHGIDNNYFESSKFVEVGLSKLDPESRNLAFSYLKKAATKGHKKAIEELKKYDSNGNLRK